MLAPSSGKPPKQPKAPKTKSGPSALDKLKAFATRELGQIGANRWEAPGGAQEASRREQADLAAAHDRTMREIAELQRKHSEMMSHAQSGADQTAQMAAQVNQQRMQELMAERTRLELRKHQLTQGAEEMRRREAELERLQLEHDAVRRDAERQEHEDQMRRLEADRLRELHRLRSAGSRTADPWAGVREPPAPTMELPMRGRDMPYPRHDPFLSARVPHDPRDMFGGAPDPYAHRDMHRQPLSNDPYFDPYASLAPPRRDPPPLRPPMDLHTIRPDDPHSSVYSRESLARHDSRPFGYDSMDRSGLGKAGWSRAPQPPTTRTVAGLQVPVHNPYMPKEPLSHVVPNVAARRAEEQRMFGDRATSQEHIDRMREQEIYRRREELEALRRQAQQRVPDPRLHRSASAAQFPSSASCAQPENPPAGFDAGPARQPSATQTFARQRTASEASVPFAADMRDPRQPDHSGGSIGDPRLRHARSTSLGQPPIQQSPAFGIAARSPAPRQTPSHGSAGPPVFDLEGDDLVLLAADPTVRDMVLERLTPSERDSLLKRLEAATAARDHAHARSASGSGGAQVRFAPSPRTAPSPRPPSQYAMSPRPPVTGAHQTPLARAADNLYAPSSGGMRVPSPRTTLGFDTPAFDEHDRSQSAPPAALFGTPGGGRAPPSSMRSPYAHPAESHIDNIVVLQRGQPTDRPVVRYIDHLVRGAEMASPGPNADPRQRIARAIMALQQQAHAAGANALIEVHVAEAPNGGHVVEGDAVVLGDASLQDDHPLPPGAPPGGFAMPPGPPPGGYAMPAGPPPGGYAMPSGPPPPSTPAAAAGGWPTPNTQTVGASDGWD